MAPLPGGEWLLSVTNPSTDGSPLSVFGFVMDYDSGWGEGFKWNEDISEAHLVGFPATSDSGIGVAAYTGHDEEQVNYFGGPMGGLESYSGRGHRIDGVQILDIAAPANPLSAECSICVNPGENTYGKMRVFGGTSGAGPHVAGTAALLKQLYPEETGLEMEIRLKNSALVDDFVTTPGNLPQADLWGAGKVMAWKAAYGTDAPVVDPPSIEGDSLTTWVDVPIALNPVIIDADTPEADLKIRFDFNYDGTFDTEYVSPGTTNFTSPEPGVFYIKAQVVDADGFTAGAILSVTVLEATPIDDTSDDKKDGCSCNAGTSSGQFPIFFILFIFSIAILIRRRSI
jgi:subtilisin family serine protease